MRKNLSTKLLDSLQPRVDRRYEVRDASMPGFGVRVAVTGAKTFFVMRRVDDRQTRHTIGTYPIVTLAEARDAARIVLRDMQLGTYGKMEPKEKVMTLGDVIADFIEICAKPKNRSWKAQAATLRKFASLAERPVAETTRADVVKVLDQIIANGAPVGANHAMATIKKVFSWAVDRGVITVHPIIGMKAPAKAQSRDRVLTDDEIKGLWLATADMGFSFGPAYRLMLRIAARDHHHRL